MGHGCCCTPSGDCCEKETKSQEVHVSFYYLDLEVCERCMGTEQNLEEAIKRVAPVLSGSGLAVRLDKRLIDSEAAAVECRFVSSPTIRINGMDLQNDVTESCCQDCGDLCGDTVDCRTWNWQGKIYERPPVDMIADGILRAAFGGSSGTQAPDGAYSLPENLKRFFRGLEAKD